jgi:hypothetical protein
MKRRLKRLATLRPDQPLGPVDCLRTRFPGKCSKCSVETARLHVPTRLVPGKYCENCCPACQVSGAQPNEITMMQPESRQGAR